MAADVARRMAGRHLLLLTDFDGTLSELAPSPDEAVLSADVRRELARLARADRVSLGVVSGRRLTDVATRVGGIAEYLAGLHGLEIIGPQERFHHHALDAVQPIVATLAEEAVRRLAWCPGCLIENKVFALTCHVRRVPLEMAGRALEAFQELAEPLLDAGVLRLLTAAQALELLPAVDWDKGRAVEWIRAHLARRLAQHVGVVYLGDDHTDEHAFSVLQDDDVAIGVGNRPHTPLIDHRLAGPASVGRFLAALEHLRAGPTSPAGPPGAQGQR